MFVVTDVDGFAAGAALGPLLAGVISPTGWNNVFYMLISADVLACLVRRSFTLSFTHLKLQLMLKIQLIVLWFVSSFFPGLCSRRLRVGVESVYPKVEGKHHQVLSGLWCLDSKMTAFSFFQVQGVLRRAINTKKGNYSKRPLCTDYNHLILAEWNYVGDSRCYAAHWARKAFLL